MSVLYMISKEEEEEEEEPGAKNRENQERVSVLDIFGSNMRN